MSDRLELRTKGDLLGNLEFTGGEMFCHLAAFKPWTKFEEYRAYFGDETPCKAAEDAAPARIGQWPATRPKRKSTRT